MCFDLRLALLEFSRALRPLDFHSSRVSAKNQRFRAKRMVANGINWVQMENQDYVWPALPAEYGPTAYGCQSCSWSADQGRLSFPVPVRACEFGLARQVRPSRSASARSFSTPKLNLVLGHGLPSFLPLSATSPIYTINSHWASPQFISSRICLRMAFTAESPPAKGQ